MQNSNRNSISSYTIWKGLAVCLARNAEAAVLTELYMPSTKLVCIICLKVTRINLLLFHMDLKYGEYPHNALNLSKSKLEEV